MLNRDLIDLINSGAAVAIIGSGISNDAGLPSWSDLCLRIAKDLDPENLKTSDALKLLKGKHYPEAFSALSGITSRVDIHARVAAIINESTRPGRHHDRISDWPFRYYVTTNYDTLIENACCSPLVSVGNLGEELRKLAAGPNDVVWHMHGSSHLDNDISRITVCKEDYSEIYPDSNIVTVLKSITQSARCIYIGFGFNDRDFMDVIKSVGRQAYAGRPSYAFMAYDESSPEERTKLEALRDEYNIEIIPYLNNMGNHSKLHVLMDSYTPLLLRRSLLHGCPPSGSPEYAPSTTSLRIHNIIDIEQLASSNPSLKQTLIGARIIAKIREIPGIDEAELMQQIVGKDITLAAAKTALGIFRLKRLINDGPLLMVSDLYNEMVASSKAKIELMRSKFLASIEVRSRDKDINEKERVSVKDTVAAFYEKLCYDQGLGVAQNLVTSDSAQIARRSVSLLKDLPEYLVKCKSKNEAIAIIEITSEIIAKPSVQESEYLGQLCQSYFGQHLAGASSRLSQIDLDIIAGTCYILDSSVLICLLAEDGRSYAFTNNLIYKAIDHKAVLTTTPLLIEEVYEHARWALQLVEKYGEASPEIIDVLRGANGYKQNQFIDGYFLGERRDSTFLSYIKRVLDIPKSGSICIKSIKSSLERRQVSVKSIDNWEGFSPLMYSERDKVQTEIKKRRIANGSYKHDRQAEAEAEVVLICDYIRKGTFLISSSQLNDAFFLSSTRVVDGLELFPKRISLLPEGLDQWLWSSGAISEAHARMVFEQLLWELAQQGIAFVDKQTILRKFGGIVEASEAELETLMSDRREYLAEEYGADLSKAFKDIDPLTMPRVNETARKTVLAKMEAELRAARISEKEALQRAKITERDKGLILKYKQKKENAKKKRKTKRRKAQAAPKKRK